MRKLITVLLCLVMLMSLSSCVGVEGMGSPKLLEKADPANSAMTIYCFDGKTTSEKWIFESDLEEKIVEEINDLKLRPASRSSIKDIKTPCYGIMVYGEEGPIKLATGNGLWVLQDGSVYKGQYDLASVFDNVSDNDMTTYDDGLRFPNSAWLGAYNTAYYRKAGDMPSEISGVSLSFVEYKDNVVTVKLRNESGNDYEYGLYFALQKQIDGEWYEIPPVKDYAFTELAYSLPAGGSADLDCSLDHYGKLDAGRYRIEKESFIFVTDGVTDSHKSLVAEFEIK